MKKAAQRVLGWFGTLSGRLTILLLVGLAVAQVATILYVLNSVERDRALEVDRAFFATLARAAQTIPTVPPPDRSRVLRSMASGGLFYWVSRGPALGPEEAVPSRDAPLLPMGWRQIASSDKRAAWYPDRRSMLMKYRIFDPPPGPSQMFDPREGLPEGPPGGAFSPNGGAFAEVADFGRPLDRPPPRDELQGEADRPERPEMAERAERPRRRPGDGGGRDRPNPPRPLGGRSFGALDDNGQPVPEWTLVRGDPVYGDAATRRPSGTMASPPIRWRASVLMEDGEWLNAEFNQMAGLPTWTDFLFLQNFIVLIISASVIIVGVGLTTKRLATLARAADRVGRGDTLEPIKESGTSEVRGLTQAFNTMSLRLRRFIEGRTQMLGAISHDLRTPITGLRLRAELVEDDENRERMLAIIDELHHLTEATLALAREDSIMERTDRVDIASLVESIADDLTDVGMDVTCTVERGVTVSCRPFSLRRAIRNLAENGVKYGKRSRITLSTTEKSVRIVIDDDGPGIPEDQLEKALLPFVRLEGSRSRETGGAGLGLAITRSIVLNHGGDLRLANRDGGGLRAIVTLPKDV